MATNRAAAGLLIMLVAASASASASLAQASAARQGLTGTRTRARAPLAAVRVRCREVHGVEAGETWRLGGAGLRLTYGRFQALNPNMACPLFPGQWVCVGGTVVG